jgi:hypothetical protein
VYADYPLFVETTDEYNSWLFNYNADKCGNATLCRELAQAGAADEANITVSISILALIVYARTHLKRGSTEWQHLLCCWLG